MRLTDAIVKKIEPPERTKITYDDDLPGFGIRVTPAGARSYVLNYRVRGRERRYTIGSAREWSCAAARKHAAELRAKIRLGQDPLADLEADRSAPTVAALCDRFEEEHLPRLREKSREQYRGALNGTARRKGIRAFLGSKLVADVTHADVEALHRHISKTAPTMANRTISVLSKMMAVAVKRGLRPDNPASGIERNPETKRHRYLSPAELAALSRALDELEDQQAANIFRLMLLTGCRRGEALSARWEHFDAGVWTKPGATTKQKTLHRVPLSQAAVELLAGIERQSEWVFPGKGGGHRVEVKAQWRKVCRAAGIEGVRMHDVRHSYASVLASAGLSLPVIGALLGHTQPATTARYAHLMDDPLREATERAAALVAGR